MSTRHVRGGVAAICALSLAACTAVTHAGDYTVGEDDESVRDLSYTFEKMSVHERETMDVAVVDENDVVQARAVMILPPVSRADDEPYPDIDLFMKSALTPGDQRLFFYIDANNDHEIGDTAEGEHIWQEPLDPDGVGSFEHNTGFKHFSEDELTFVGGDVVLELPELASGGGDARLCLRDRLGDRISEQLEVKVTLVDKNRQVGLFSMGPEGLSPRDGRDPLDEIPLKGIVDAGSEYRFEVVVDGDPTKSFDRRDEGGDIVVRFEDWFPLRLADLAGCLP